MVRVGTTLFLAFVSFVLTDNANVGITCSLCRSGLASMKANIQSNPDLMSQIGDTISQGCDQIPDELQRKACRMTLDDHFPLFLQTLSKQTGISVDDFCKSMGYCQ